MKMFFKLMLMAMFVVLVVSFVGLQSIAGGAITEKQETWLKEAQIGQYQSVEEDWDSIYENAKKEGKLVFLSLSSRFPEVVDSFTEAYPGIEVEASDMIPVDQVDKLTREQDAGIYYIDVLFLDNGPLLIEELLPEHLIWSYTPTTLIDGKRAEDVIPQKYMEPLQLHSVETKQIFYNFETYDSPPIENLWDLTTPEWEGKVQCKDPLLAMDTMNFLQLVVRHSNEMEAAYKERFGKDLVLSEGIENAGYEWIKRLIDNGLLLTTSDGKAALACGTPGQEEPPLAFVSSSKLRYNLTKGTKLAACSDTKPVEGIVKENYVVIANLAPHPNAAKLFIRWMLGDEKGEKGFVPFHVEGQYASRSDVLPLTKPLNEMSLWFVDEEREWIYYEGIAVVEFWLTLR